MQLAKECREFIKVELDIKTQYIVQAITNAANNLRLSSEKIEVVTLLREHLASSENLESEIARLKKITEFSKLAVRLSELYNYISGNLLDFNKLSDIFREHSHSLVRELSNLLDVVTPMSFMKIISGDKEQTISVDFTIEKKNSIRLEDITSDVLQTATKSEDFFSKEPETKSQVELPVESSTDFNYDVFVESVLDPIKQIDAFLTDLEFGRRDEEKIEIFYDWMIRNKNLSKKAGLEIVAKMHALLQKSFELIRDHEFNLSKENLDSLRACLIVIVAVVRQKDVDISSFIEKAEKLNYIL
ncbi:MAG: hypothetical protein D6830_04395 [Ignavibacteria bacterium]|nr:MAG: hypothetical protein D6830_04395 [Ignavibacteria bacterium]